jgi:hypothetical protein
MDNCYQYEELISDYIENLLDSNSRQQFDNHQKKCLPCARKTNNIKVLHNSLTIFPVKEVSSDFDSMLRARIRIENKRERQKRQSLLFSWKIRVPIYGMSVVLILFILMTVVTQLSNKNTFPPVASMNPEWQNRTAITQNISTGVQTVYSLEYKSAIDVLSQQPSKHLNERAQSEVTSADSSSLTVYNEPKNNLSDNFYQTSF